jgi:hypothetical protein
LFKFKYFFANLDLVLFIFDNNFLIASRIYNCENGPCNIEFLTNAVNNTITTIQPPTTNAQLNLGAIIGGTVGGFFGLVLIAIIVVITIVCIRKFCPNDIDKKDEDKKNQNYDETYYNKYNSNNNYESRVSNRYSDAYDESYVKSLYENVNKNKRLYENEVRPDSIEIKTINN